MVNKKRLIRLTQKLIRINSENPPGDESAIAKFIQRYLADFGVRCRAYAFKKRRLNIIAALGAEKKPSLLISPHLDTVPAGKSWSMPPFAAAIKQKKIYGLGATDCKGNLACALEAINSIVEEGVCLDYHLIFAATADEESGSSLGLIPLLDRGILVPEAAVILDADDFDIIVAQKGLIHLKVAIRGKRAHGAYPWRGVNAIEKATAAIQELKTRKFPYLKNKYLRGPTVNIGTIGGGDKVNVVADWCEFELDFRFLPGMSSRKILKDLRQIIGKHTKNFSLKIEGIQEPYRIKESSPLVSCLSQAMRRHHIQPCIKGSEGATVITFFQRKNIPAIATGFGSGGCAHSIDEYVKVDNLYRGALVLEDFLKSYKLQRL